jgi:hypothetical protein
MERRVFDLNLLILAIHKRSSQLLSAFLFLDTLLILYPAIIIFANPISLFGWVTALRISNNNTRDSLEHDTVHNTIWYNEFVSLPLITLTFTLTALTLVIRNYAYRVVVSADADFYVITSLDKPVLNVTSERLIENRQLYSRAVQDQFVTIDNQIYNLGTRVYSKLLLAEVSGNDIAFGLFSRFNVAFIHLAYALRINKIPNELTLKLIDTLGVRYIMQLLKIDRFYEDNNVYRTEHTDRLVTWQNNSRYITPGNLDFMLEGFKRYRIAKYCPVLEVKNCKYKREPSHRSVTEQEPDTENQLANLQRPRSGIT